ncbi:MULTISPECIES: hypothetical protein [unclassified Butyrivibrio]|nr:MULTISPECIES: hypothetical protein [unclassified Butyrivibrio]
MKVWASPKMLCGFALQRMEVIGWKLPNESIYGTFAPEQLA